MEADTEGKGEESLETAVVVCPRCTRRWQVAARRLAMTRRLRCSACNEAWLHRPQGAGVSAKVRPPLPARRSLGGGRRGRRSGGPRFRRARCARCRHARAAPGFRRPVRKRACQKRARRERARRAPGRAQS